MVDMLLGKLAQSAGGTVCINDKAHAFTSDIAGEIGFSQSYEQIEADKLDPIITKIRRDLQWTIYATSIRWLANAPMRIPGLESPIGDLKKDLLKKTRSTRDTDAKSSNVLSYLLQDETLKNDENILVDEMRLLQIAASNTSYSTIVFILSYFANSTELQSAIHSEISSVLATSNVPIWSALQTSSLLVRETLRLHPLVRLDLPHELPRYDPANIGPYHIPGETMISVPTYSLHVDESYFEQAEKWIPDRCSIKTEMIIDKRTWVRFGTGPTACAGRLFAMMEITLWIGRIVQNFEISWPKGRNGETLLTENKDYFITWLPNVDMCFVKRTENHGKF